MTTPTTPEIWCINVLLDSPNGNVQLVYNNFLKANSAYDALTGPSELPTIKLDDSYGQKVMLRLSSINTVILSDTAATMRGGADIALIRAVSEQQLQNRAAQNPTLKAASMMRNFNGAMGPANG